MAKPTAVAYFISDLHLGAYPEMEKTSLPLLMGFLEMVRERKADLFIVGDLLDFWFEYNFVVPSKPFRLLAKLRSMTDSGCKIVYIAGNHDYWLGSFMKDEVGIQICKGCLDLAIDDKRFFICHGDDIPPISGTGYWLAKSVLRSRPVSWLFKLVHPDIGIQFARLISRLSRRRSSNNNRSPNLYPFVMQKSKQGYDFVIMGHLHSAKIFDVESTRCLIIGDWIDTYSYGVFENGTLRLERWSK